VIPNAPHDGEAYDQVQRTIDVSPSLISTADSVLAAALPSNSKQDEKTTVPLFLRTN
jgi:hypothetical protein